MERKDFIKTMARTSILAIMGAMTGAFIVRKKLAFRSECRLNGHCGQCQLLSGCRLPEAKKERENGKG